MSNSHFESCQKYVNEAEGGANFTVVNGKPVLKGGAKYDRGGPTKYGITWQTLCAACSKGIVPHSDITQLTKAEALEIYKANYWIPSHADEMDWGLCLVHYDCAVNCGLKSAGRQLQRALNMLGENLSEDGAIGPKTKAAIKKHPVEKIVEAYLKVRESFYRGLVERDSNQGVFLKGWLNRLEKIRRGAF